MNTWPNRIKSNVNVQGKSEQAKNLYVDEQYIIILQSVLQIISILHKIEILR